MSWIANVAYAAAAILYLPVLAYQMIAQNKNRRGWRERLLGPRVGQRDAVRPIWVHGVSLGEINAARALVDRLEAVQDAPIVISATTDTGYARAATLFGASRVFRFPLDFSWSVRRTLDRIDPVMIVLMELEVWFNLTTLAARRGIDVVVVNGRLTDRSCRRLAWLGQLSRRMFRALTWVGAQDATIGERFVSLGLPQERLTVTGSMKWDTATVSDSIEGADRLAAAMGMVDDQPLWVCGSTGPGEETMLLDIYRALRTAHPTLQLAMIPRKPERFDEVARLIERAGFTVRRRSACPDGSAPGSDGNVVLLGDTMGELRKFYARASVVFVGRTLVAMGGSDPMEVAALGKAIVIGPHVDNFAAPVRALEADDAIRRAANREQVRALVDELLSQPDLARAIGTRAQRVVRANQGATEATVRRLIELVADGRAVCEPHDHTGVAAPR